VLASYAAKREDVDLYQWSIRGAIVTATAAQLNQLNTGAMSVSTLAVSGKSTLNGELEVNNSDVDINMTLTDNEIDITQANETGTASTPLIKVTDKRTGATANEASEAGWYIDSDGAYAIAIADGILQIEAEIDTATGDILLDPAGGEVHIDGGLHVGGTDAVGDNNLKVDGTLTQVGTATFTLAPVMTALTASKPVFTDGSKLLTSSGTLSVDQGGSGAATLIDHGVLVGSGTLAVTPLAVGTDGQLLVGASSADPAWATVGGAFSMAAGGTSTLIGNIAQARITNALVDAIGPDQMADADHGDVAWSSGVASVEAINSVAVATVTAGAAAGATALQPNTIVTAGVTNGVDTAAFTVTNGLGAASTIVGIWSASLNGAASAVNLTSIAATTGTLLSAANSPTIVVVTDASGYAAFTVTVSAASTNYVAFIQNNGVRKSSAEMVFDGP
jgi:hypothetical protein